MCSDAAKKIDQEENGAFTLHALSVSLQLISRLLTYLGQAIHMHLLVR